MLARPETQRFSLRIYLMILIGAIVLPLAVVIGYSVYKDTQQAISEARATVQTLTTVIAANTSRTLSANRARMELLAARPLMRAVDETRCDPILPEYKALFPQFANLTTIDLNGRAVCSAVPQPGGKPVDVSQTEWFRRALNEKRFLAGYPFRGPITGKWVSVLVLPIHAEGNQLKGFMGLPLDLRSFDPSVSAVKIPDNSRYGLVGGNGTLIWRNVDPENIVGTNRSDLSAVRNMLRIKHGEFDDTGVDGVHRYFAVAPIPEVGWYAYAAVPYGTIDAEIRASLLRGGLLGAWYLALVTGLAIFLARRIEQPMKALARVARNLRRGDISARARQGGPREVTEVAAEFNALVDAWSLSTGQLRASEERFRTVADYAGDWEYWEGPNRELFYMSPSCEGITGYPRERFIEDRGLLDRIVHPDDAAAVEAHQKETDQSLLPSQLDFRIIRSDGSIRWIAHQCAAVRDSNGRFNGRRVNNRDITERKRAEKEREEYFAFFNASLDLMGIADPNGAFKKINPAFSRLLGYTDEEILARPFIDFVYQDDKQPTLDEMSKQLQRGYSLDFENRYVCKDGTLRWLSWRANVNQREGLTYATARDITERKETERRLARLSSLYAALGETNEAIARIRDRNVLLREVCRIIVAYGHFQAAFVGMLDAEGRLAIVADYGDTAGYFDRVAISADATFQDGSGPADVALRENRHVICNDFLRDGCTLPLRGAALREGFRSCGAFPLRSDGKAAGALGLCASSVGFFDDELVELVLRLTEDVSLALDNIELDERRRRAEEQLTVFSKRLKLATEAAAIGIWEIDSRKREYVWDKRMFEMLGLAPDVPVTGELWRNTVYPEDWAGADAAIRRALAGERISSFVFRIIRHGDGAVRYIQSFATPSREATGEVSKVVGVNVDITERKHMEQALREMATTDALTGLPNRRQFMNRFEDLLAQVQRQVTASAAVLMLDLDHFKRVNDQHGHAAGDAVLKNFAALAAGELRKIDLVGRIGGEEFAIALPGADPEAARRFAERLCRKVCDSPASYEGQPIPVTVSIGIAELDAADSNVDAVLNRADEALYRAKEAGRNRVVLYQEPELL